MLNMEENKFFEDFYLLAKNCGKVEELIKNGLMVNETTIAPKGAELILKYEEQKQEVSFAEQYRDLFKAKNIGIAGKASDPYSVANKMARFKLQYPYSVATILQATEYYLQTVDNPRYIMEADYFIFKKDGVRSEEKSKLAAFCEEILERGEMRGHESL